MKILWRCKNGKELNVAFWRVGYAALLEKKLSPNVIEKKSHMKGVKNNLTSQNKNVDIKFSAYHAFLE